MQYPHCLFSLDLSELSVLMWVTLREKFNYYVLCLPSPEPFSANLEFDWYPIEKESGQNETDKKNKEKVWVYAFESKRWTGEKDRLIKYLETVWWKRQWADREVTEYKDTFQRKCPLTFTVQPICPWWRPEWYRRHIQKHNCHKLEDIMYIY